MIADGPLGQRESAQLRTPVKGIRGPTSERICWILDLFRLSLFIFYVFLFFFFFLLLFRSILPTETAVEEFGALASGRFPSHESKNPLGSSPRIPRFFLRGLRAISSPEGSPSNQMKTQAPLRLSELAALFTTFEEAMR